MSRRALALFILLSVLWGVPYLLIKVAVAEVSVPFVVFARSALGVLVLAPFAVMQNEFAKVIQRWRPVVAFAVVEMVVPWGLIVHGEVRLNSSTTGLLVAATPMIAVLIGRWGPSPERMSVGRFTGLLLGLAGVATLAGPHFSGDAFPVTEILLAAVCYAAGSAIAARWLGDVPTVPMTAACLAVACVAYAIPAALARPEMWPSIQASTAIVALGVACTAVAFASFFLLVREVGSERAVVITYLAPAVSVASGAAFLGEPISSRLLVAFALILGGSWLATSYQQKQDAKVSV